MKKTRHWMGAVSARPPQGLANDFSSVNQPSVEALRRPFHYSPSDIQWIESFVAADKTFCVYLAKDEAVIRKHADISGFPATRITEVSKTIDPTTERAA